jgi:hypothetical protein
MKLKKGLIALLAMIVIALPLFTSACGLPNGTVDYKAITASTGNTNYDILLNRPIDEGEWILVDDNEFADYFSDSDKNAFVSESLEHALKLKYHKVIYWVAIIPDGSDYGEMYQVSRETFNQLEPGSTVK